MHRACAIDPWPHPCKERWILQPPKTIAAMQMAVEMAMVATTAVKSAAGRDPVAPGSRDSRTRHAED